jgi:hypothetical protein
MASIERDLDYVLVTGAGASVPFGLNNTRLAAMAEWAEALVTKLNTGATGYFGATGLYPTMGATQFEAQLGRFLNQVTAFTQIKDVVAASKQFAVSGHTGAQQLNTEGLLEAWYENTKGHLGRIVDLTHESLYEQFAEPAWDPARAQSAYGDLLQALGINPSSRWVYATTNYDRIGETAVQLLGMNPDWGEPPQTGNAGERPIEVDRLIDGIPRYVPVLHLHGRVGWFRRLDFSEASAIYSTPATRYQAGFGVPIVMLPDPNKAYDSDPIINSLWTQFIQSLRRAKRVFVLGHSLNDRQVLEAIRDNVQSLGSIGVAVLSKEGTNQIDESASEVEARVEEELGSAAVIPLRFGEPSSGHDAIENWLARERAKGA